MSREHKRSFLLLLLLAAAVLMACVILSFSLRSGASSNMQSEQVRRALAAVLHRVGIQRPNLRFIDWFYPYDAHGDLGNTAVRKMAHLSEYALFGIVCAAAFSLLRNRRAAVAINLAVGPLLALLDEKYVQTALSVGRTPSYRDVVLDSLGFFVGSLVVVLLLRLRAVRQKRRGM